MAFKVVGGRLIRVIKKSEKKSARRARGADGGSKHSKTSRIYRDRGVTHPFSSARADLRIYRRAQGGPGITEGQRPQPRGVAL